PASGTAPGRARPPSSPMRCIVQRTIQRLPASSSPPALCGPVSTLPVKPRTPRSSGAGGGGAAGAVQAAASSSAARKVWRGMRSSCVREPRQDRARGLARLPAADELERTTMQETGSCCHAADAPRTTTPADAGVEFTCPMHPEVRQLGPGNCPKCGMALEPVSPTAADEQGSPAVGDLRRRLWIAALLTPPVVAAAMRHMLPGRPLDHWLSARAGSQVQLALTTPVVWWCGWPLLVRALESLRHRSPNMFTLIGLGVVVAWAHGTLATLAPSLFPDSFRAADGEVFVYFESAAVIVTLVLLGQVLELRARARTGAAIRELVALAPRSARRIDADGAEHDVPIEQVAVGDRLRVRPGEKVPVDGE